jgi:hypothetical protein
MQPCQAEPPYRETALALLTTRALSPFICLVTRELDS